MTWQIAIAISIAASVLTTLIQRRYAQQSSAPASFPSAASYIFGVLPIGYIAGFLVFPHHVNWSWWLVLLLVIEGAAMAISGWTGFNAAGRLGIAQRMTIGRITGITVILLGWTLLSEKLTLYQCLGAAILLVGALLAIWAPTKSMTEAHKRFHTSSIWLTIIAAITGAIGLVTEKGILGHMQLGGGFLVGWSAQALAMLVLAGKDFSKQNLRQFKGYEFKWSVLMGLANGLTGVFYVYAIVHANNVSRVTALTIVGLPLTVLCAYVFLKERENQKLMWVSLAISFVGLLVSTLH